MKRRIILIIFLVSIHFLGLAQSNDSTSIVIEKVHSPKKATLMSLVLPGLGQAYNKKYWKIPIVYGMIGTTLYLALNEQKEFNDFKSAYIKRVDDDTLTNDTKYINIYTDQNLLSLIDNRRKNRDLLFVLTGVSYALNVLDAAVDAHLISFDVSDDIAGTLRPSIQYQPIQQVFTPSLTLSLKFAKKDRRKNF